MYNLETWGALWEADGNTLGTRKETDISLVLKESSNNMEDHP
jgi:hypothetical protein